MNGERIEELLLKLLGDMAEVKAKIRLYRKVLIFSTKGISIYLMEYS